MTSHCSASLSLGLSTRVRGNRLAPVLHPVGHGSIPARAGEPAHRWAVYPRACGGTRVNGVESVNIAGLSPRVRGNLGFTALEADLDGSIPARAGEPPLKQRSPEASRVYPRACGGTGIDLENISVEVGLSPRVRGNQ